MQAAEATYVVAYGYIALLGALTLGVTLFGKAPGMLRTILAILANYALATAYTLVTRQSDAWGVFMLLDLISATVILVQPAGKMQALIGWTYVGQIAMHTGYALNAHHDPLKYWWLLAVSGLLQLILVGVWLSGSRIYLGRVRGFRGMAFAPSPKGVEG